MGIFTPRNESITMTDLSSTTPQANAGAADGATYADNAQSRRYAVTFTGSGGEYFRIWMVNILLSIVTLGIYSAWAKVRTMQYFARNTRAASASFDYHAKPTSILIGQGIAFGLIVLASSAELVGPWVAGAALMVVSAGWPWLLQRSLRFRLGNTSWRNVRFGFDGTAAQAYRQFWPWVAFSVLSGLATALVPMQADDEEAVTNLMAFVGVMYLPMLISVPWLLVRIHKYAAEHARFGNGRFRLELPSGAYAGIFLKAFLVILAVTVAVIGAVLLFGVIGGVSDGASGKFFGGLGVVVSVLVLYLAWFAVAPAAGALMYNRRWSGTSIPGALNLYADLSWQRWAGLQIVNWVLVLVTLGFYRPFAMVASTRLKLQSTQVELFLPFMELVHQATEAGAAAGDEIADALGFDIAL